MTQGKTTLTGFTIQLGLVNIRGSLIQTVLDRADTSTGLKLACPECAGTGTASKGTQTYICEVNPEHRFTNSEARRAKPIGKGKAEKLVLLTTEQADALKTPPSQFVGTLDLVSSKLDQIGTFLIPSGDAWVFIPEKFSERIVSLMCDVLTHTDAVLTGVTCLRSNGEEKWVRLVVAPDGNLVLQSLIWPEQIAEFPKPPTGEYSTEERDMFTQVIDNIYHEFDPSEIRRTAKVRHEALMESLATSGIVPAVSADAPSSGDNLLDMLKASLADATR